MVSIGVKITFRLGGFGLAGLGAGISHCVACTPWTIAWQGICCCGFPELPDTRADAYRNYRRSQWLT